jgi:hypothetical protein
MKKGEIPIQAESRQRKILWERAKNASNLSTPRLIATIATFASSVLGASSQVKGLSVEANRLLRQMKKELRSRYATLEDTLSSLQQRYPARKQS